MSVTIRAARADEFDQIAGLWLASWNSTGLGGPNDLSLDDLRARISREIDAGWRLFVAELDGEMAAMLAIRPPDHLDQIFVIPACQGRGVGKALMAFTRAQMPDKIWLRTHVDNTRACHWYEREGFVLERVEQPPGEPLLRAYYRWKRPAAG